MIGWIRGGNLNRRNFIQVGIASKIECAKLFEPEGHLDFDLPNINEGEWHGLAIDVHPASTIRSVKKIHNSELLRNRLKIINAAVSGKAGFCTIQSNTIEQPDLNCMISDVSNNVQVSRPFAFDVYAVTLDAIFSQIDGGIDLLFMNVEGSEGDILQSCQWTKLPGVIAVQTHSKENVETVHKSLEELFAHVKITNSFIKDRSYGLPWHIFERRKK